MKQKYILGIYDKLIKDIKHPANGKEAEIISYLKKQTQESHFIHQIQFLKQKDTFNYTIQQKVHNLHPLAPEIKANAINTIELLDQLIPQILRELNIPEARANYYWVSINNKSSLIIKENCNIEDLSTKERFFLYCSQMVKNENHKILKKHKEIFFNLSSKAKMEQYIHRRQKALEYLSYDLIKDINPAISKDIYNFSSDYDKIDCLKIVYISLEKILIYFEKECRNFMDANTTVPYRSILTKEMEIKCKLKYVQSRLLEVSCGSTFMEIVLLPLKKMAKIDIKEKITYSEFSYYCEYIEVLYKRLKDKNSVEVIDIKGWLFDLNYNSLEFFYFKTDQIISCVGNLESEIDKIGTLYQLLKSYNQRHAISHSKLNQNLPSIKDQLISWVDEEIEYLTRKNKLESNQNISEPVIKIKTIFSVAQLCSFFKFLVQCQILEPKNHNDIFKLICTNFKTHNVDKISYQSAKKNYYNSEQTTVNYVRTKIIELMNLTKS